jgi:hypothetical protein
MNKPETPPNANDDYWVQRRRNNARLGWVFGGVAFLVFLIALWKFRPL